MDTSVVSSLNTGKLHATFPVGRNHKSYAITCKAINLSLGKEVDHYKVLALDSKNVGVEAIKRAYRRMVLLYHPDVCPPSKREESTQMFIELQRAYETLSDPVLREIYDRQMALVEVGDQEEFKGAGRTIFPKEVWINQLNELEDRSAERIRKKKMGCS
ncbi:chaperone protein dnaJ 20, chloroplastic-like [Elaeis guineensis]|uniref:chaperone protein dnaJ 20, chloroplastic-like n=1 Tax=Elaeis guineensis var. tenera TaxID=51953 RepID=UPI00057A8A11